MNNIIACIKSVFQKYATFEGRASRPEFWWFYLLNMVVGALCNALGKVGIWIQIVWIVAILVPSLAVGVRRLHDIGKSGWNWFIGLIPIVGAIILIIWWAKPGDEGENQYGPKAVAPTAE